MNGEKKKHKRINLPLQTLNFCKDAILSIRIKVNALLP